MNYRKTLLTAGVVSGIAFTGLAGVSAVSAASLATSTDGPTSLIEKLAAKFNLNKDEVKAVFEEERTARQAEHQQKVEERLTQAVTDGKITADQKSKILAKAKELQAQREANRTAMEGKTHEERKANMDANRTALEKWATDNGIAKEYLHFVMGGGHGHGGPGGPGRFGGDAAPNSTTQH